MTEVVLIRRFDDPIGRDYLDAATAALGWCREIYAVTPRLHFLAHDGLRCACIYGAPDAEAVRHVIRAGQGSEPEALWPCTIHPAPDDDGNGAPDAGTTAQALIVVERAFAQPMTFGDVQTIVDENLPCFHLHEARSIRSYFSADRRRMMCLYAAPDAEAVRHANRQAGLPFERAWPAQVILA
jgi:hypothetical protein